MGLPKGASPVSAKVMHQTLCFTNQQTGLFTFLQSCNTGGRMIFRLNIYRSYFGERYRHAVGEHHCALFSCLQWRKISYNAGSAGALDERATLLSVSYNECTTLLLPRDERKWNLLRLCGIFLREASRFCSIRHRPECGETPSRQILTPVRLPDHRLYTFPTNRVQCVSLFVFRMPDPPTIFSR